MDDAIGQQLLREVAELRGDVRALTARVDERLEHGSRKLDDHEMRLRGLERTVPLDTADRLERLEQDRQRRLGKADVVTVLGSIFSGSAASAVISWALTRH